MDISLLNIGAVLKNAGLHRISGAKLMIDRMRKGWDPYIHMTFSDKNVSCYMRPKNLLNKCCDYGDLPEHRYLSIKGTTTFHTDHQVMLCYDDSTCSMRVDNSTLKGAVGSDKVFYNITPRVYNVLMPRVWCPIYEVLAKIDKWHENGKQCYLYGTSDSVLFNAEKTDLVPKKIRDLVVNTTSPLRDIFWVEENYDNGCEITVVSHGRKKYLEITFDDTPFGIYIKLSKGYIEDFIYD